MQGIISNDPHAQVLHRIYAVHIFVSLESMIQIYAAKGPAILKLEMESLRWHHLMQRKTTNSNKKLTQQSPQFENTFESMDIGYHGHDIRNQFKDV